MKRNRARSRGFKVTILRDNKEVATYEIEALIRADAEEQAWNRYEAAHGRIQPRDPRYNARSEEF